MTKLKIKKNDTVIVLTGEDKGKTGKVLKVLKDEQRAIEMAIKDFEAFRKEEEKTEASINKAQAKLDEFVNKFKSKTGGNAQFVEGFKELENFKVNKDNIEDSANYLHSKTKNPVIITLGNKGCYIKDKDS